MKSLYPGIIPELDKEIELSEKEQKALHFYVNLGRFFIISSAICSFILVPFLLTQKSIGPLMLALLLFWGGLAAISVFKSTPIIFFILKNFIACGFCKNVKQKDELWERGRILLSAFFGWDLLYQKKVGAKGKLLDNAEDFWSNAVLDKEAMTKYAKSQLGYFNDRKEVDVKDKLVCYRCFFEAAHNLKMIDTKFYYNGYPSPIAIERFLTCLGEEYQYTSQNFGKSKLSLGTPIKTSLVIGTAQKQISILKEEMRKYLNNSQLK